MDEEEAERGLWRSFLDDINPIDVDGWAEMGVVGKIYECFKVSGMKDQRWSLLFIPPGILDIYECFR